MKKLHMSQRGFTLVELLIVVAILGILAAVAVPSLQGLTSTAKTKAAQAELSTVQSSVDAMMADIGIQAITSPATAATNNMSAFPSTNTPAQQLYPKYLRSPNTNGTYTCDEGGAVTQVSYP